MTILDTIPANLPLRWEPDTWITESHPQQNGHPALNPLIFDIVRWAEGDAAFEKWGVWDQGSWASINVSPVLADLLEGIDRDDDGQALGDDHDKMHTIVESVIRTNLCGSAYCMAGQAVSQAGFRIIVDDLVYGSGDVGSTEFAEQCVREEYTGRRDEKGLPIFEDVGSREPIYVTARQVLGLEDYEADRFFDGNNTIEVIRGLVNHFCDSRGLPVPYRVETTEVYEEDN